MDTKEMRDLLEADLGGRDKLKDFLTYQKATTARIMGYFFIASLWLMYVILFVDMNLRSFILPLVVMMFFYYTFKEPIIWIDKLVESEESGGE